MVSRYNFREVENKIKEFWKTNIIYQKAKQKNKGKEKFYFLQGPPYTSGKIHLGHAWNMSLKDMVLRIKRFKGYDVFDRAGYDMHGLPTANAVMKKLGLKHKDEIKEFGVEKFIKECRKLALENLEKMNIDFKNLGVWMDFDNAYKPIDNDFMSGEWWLIKQAHLKNRLYKSKKVMHWCASCSTALAKHELEYNNIKDNSIFLKFKLKDLENEYLVIWTTTPWTIPFNMAVMVNPELDYVKAELQINNKKEIWIIAKNLVNVILQGLLGKEYKIIKEFKGKELEGLKYYHPLKDEIDFSDYESEALHSVLMSEEYVTATAGSGLVHCAPGCGPEDYEVGIRNGLKPFNEVQEDGTFSKKMKKYSGWRAKLDDPKFIKEFEEKGFLITTNFVEHDYAHCWRCHKPVIFRATPQWFFKVEDLKENLIEINNNVNWNPKAAYNAFDSWLKNLRDNSITRQRYWGTPVPIWVCENKECNHYEVIGSLKELKEKAINQVPDDLHRPYIDNVLLKCPKCNSNMKRIPDILDVWIDSGTSSWNALYYPNKKELFEK